MIPNRRWFIATVCSAVWWSGLAQAEEPIVVKADEIKSLLSGNTIHGIWFGDEYRQYFRKSGTTSYLARGSRPSEGKWRVKASDNTYESYWEQGGWSSYRVVRIGGELHWTTLAGKDPQPFKILAGHQMVWPQ